MEAQLTSISDNWACPQGFKKKNPDLDAFEEFNYVGTCYNYSSFVPLLRTGINKAV